MAAVGKAGLLGVLSEQMWSLTAPLPVLNSALAPVGTVQPWPLRPPSPPPASLGWPGWFTAWAKGAD